MSTITSPIYSMLLEVFRYGLQLGLISRGEILSVINEIDDSDAPRDIFAAISNSYDETWLLGYVVKNDAKAASGLPIRVILAICYRKFLERTISTEKFSGVYEDFQYATFDVQDQLIADVIHYAKTYSDNELAGIIAGRWPVLSLYKEFKLDNYNSWFEIDSRIEDIFRAELAREQSRNQRYYKARNKKIATINVKRKIAITGLTLFAAFVFAVDYQLAHDETPISIFKIEVSEPTVLQVNIVGGLLLIRVGYDLWKWKRMKARQG